MLCGPYDHSRRVRSTACVTTDLDHALSYALRWQGTLELSYIEQRPAIERWDVFVWLPSHRPGGVSMLPDSSLCLYRVSLLPEAV